MPVITDATGTRVLVELTIREAFELANGAVTRRAVLDQHLHAAMDRSEQGPAELDLIEGLRLARQRTLDGLRKVCDAAGFDDPELSESEYRMLWGDR
jgi:hypothetical protein